MSEIINLMKQYTELNRRIVDGLRSAKVLAHDLRFSIIFLGFRWNLASIELMLVLTCRLNVSLSHRYPRVCGLRITETRIVPTREPGDAKV